MFNKEKLQQAVVAAIADSILTNATAGSDSRPNFVIGETVLIRTVTYAAIGKVSGLNDTFVWLEAGSGWLADSGRYSEALSTGEVNEFEKCIGERRVSIGAIVDVDVWTHPIPGTK